jgi:NADH:quinone reductase (non-electrogenic)
MPAVTDRPRVVVVGAGFGGLWAARALARSQAEVVLVDRRNYHSFFPLLYQVAAAELEPEDIAFPVRSILRGLPNIQFVLAEVQAIDPVARLVKLLDRVIPYAYLILAPGSVPHFFAVPGAKEYSFPLKTLEQAVALRNHILRCFERASQEPDAARREQILTFAIVGGGPTGVEFAGALSELIRGPLCKDLSRLDLREVRVLLLEALDHLLSRQPDRLAAYSQQRLRSMGVQVRTRAVVREVTPDALLLKDGTTIPAETVIWTAGVRGAGATAPFDSGQILSWGLPATQNGRIPVLPTLQVRDYPEIYVVGDLAWVEDDSKPLPMLAPVAIQQGTLSARNIERQLAGKNPLPFSYRDRGTMTTIGRNAAVAYVRGHAFTGFVAWAIWLTVHIFNLIGFRNRLIVIINWAWDYFFFERGVRSILPSTSAPEPELSAASKPGVKA